MIIKYSTLTNCRILDFIFNPYNLFHLCYSASNQLGFTGIGIQPHVQMIIGTHSLHIENHATANLKAVQYINERLFIPKCSNNRTEIRKAQKE